MIESVGAAAPSRSLHSFSLLIILLLSILHLCDTRQLRWTAEGDGSLQDATNWNTGELPTAEDDLIIALPNPTSSTSSRHLFTTARLLSSSFSPPTLDELDDTLELSLTAPLMVSSLTLTGGGTLIVDQPLSVDGKLVIGAESIVRVRGGELTASSIECDGVLTLELGSLSSTSTPAASASSSGTLHLSRDALLLLSGPGGSNHIQHYTVDVQGGMVTLNAPLLLQHATLRIQPSGALVFHSELLSTEGDDTVSHIDNDGTLLVTGDDKQSLLVPFTNTGNLTLLSASALSILAPLHSDGTITTRNTHRLLLAAPVTLSSSASLHLLDSSAVHVQSNRLTNRGVIHSPVSAAGSELVVWSALNGSGGSELDVRRLMLREGAVWGVVREGRSVVRQLQWSGGQIAGSGTVSVVDGRIGGSGRDDGEAGGSSTSSSAVPKVLDGVELAVSGQLMHDTSAVLMLRGGAQLSVSELGEYSMRAGATLHCDTDESQLTVLGRLTVQPSPQQPTDIGDSNDDELPTVSINLPLVCRGNFTLLGPSTTVLHRSSSIDHITSQSSPILILQPTTATASYTFHQPLHLSSAGSRLILHTARDVTLLSTAPSEVDTVEIQDGRLQLNGGLRVSQLRIGTASSPGVLEGDAVVEAGRLLMVAGSMQLRALRVSDGMVVQHSAAKHIDVRNLTLLSHSVSRIQPTLLSLSSNTTVVLQSDATLTLSPAVTLYTANATADDGSHRTAQLHIHGSLLCAGSGHGTTSLLVDVTHTGSLTVNNSVTAGQYTVHIAGWTGTLSSNIAVGATSLLLQACPARYSGGGCQYGQLGGGGAVSVKSGHHTFLSPLSLHALSMDGGTARCLSWLTLRHMQLSQGELILHSSLNASTLLWSGGTVRGYPLLSSAIQLLPDGSASFASNSTLTLDGVALMLHCPLHWAGGDLMLRNAALLRVERDGAVEVRSGGGREVTVVTDGSSSRIENAGSVVVRTPLTLHVPLANSGKVQLLNASELSMHADYVQAGEQSSLRVEEGSQVWKTGGDVMVAQGSVSVVSGTIHGNVEVRGDWIVQDGRAEALVDGDLILSPSASIHLHCQPSHCLPLTVNGTLYANGRLVTVEAAAGAIYHVLDANKVQGEFIRQPHQRITHSHGMIDLHITNSQADDTAEPATPPPPLYLPFLPLSDYLSAAALAQQSANVSCASQLQSMEAGGVLGMSRRSSTATVVALICLSSTMAVILAGMLWWWWRDSEEARRGQQRGLEDGVGSGRVRREEAGDLGEQSVGAADVAEQQMQPNVDVHYM